MCVINIKHINTVLFDEFYGIIVIYPVTIYERMYYDHSCYSRMAQDLVQGSPTARVMPKETQ